MCNVGVDFNSIVAIRRAEKNASHPTDHPLLIAIKLAPAPCSNLV